MSTFQKLSQINKDIELLEAFGDIKSANILHKKFLRVSQELVSEQVKSREDLMKEIFLLAQNPNDDFEKLVKWYENDPGRYSQEDRDYIDKAIEKATDQRNELGKFTTVINPDNPTLIQLPKKDTFIKLENPLHKSPKKSDEKTTKMPILDEREQGYVYRRIVGRIKEFLKDNKEDPADKLALDYENFFENPKRNEAFKQQVINIYKNFNKSSPFVSE